MNYKQEHIFLWNCLAKIQLSAFTIRMFNLIISNFKLKIENITYEIHNYEILRTIF